MTDDLSSLELELFVAGDTRRSREAVQTLTELLKSHGLGEGNLTVCDLQDDPSRAAEQNILAIPTLIRQSPQPAVRVIGDFSDRDRVWSLLSG